MLPAEAFKPRSPPRAQNQGQQQFGSYQDEYYDDFYPEENQNTSYSSSNYEVIKFNIALFFFKIIFRVYHHWN